MSIQSIIDGIVPADIQGDLSGGYISTFMYAIAKALSERNISCGQYVDHSQEMILQPDNGKVTAWETMHEYEAQDIVTHNSKRWFCNWNHGDIGNASFDEIPGATYGVINCTIPVAETTFDIVTNLTVPGNVDILKTGTNPVLDSNILVYEITRAADRIDHIKTDGYNKISYVVDSPTQLTVTVVGVDPLVELKIQRKPAWSEVSIDGESSILNGYFAWMNTYISNFNALEARTSNNFVIPDTVAPILINPIVLDAAISKSDEYIQKKLEWMVTQLQKLTWIDQQFSTWHRRTISNTSLPYYNSTKFIDGNQQGIDAGSEFGQEMFDDVDNVGFRGASLVKDGGSSMVINANGFLRPRSDIPSNTSFWPGRHAGSWYVQNFDWSFDFSGTGRIQIGELECDADVANTRIWLPSLREEQNRYYYEIAEALTAFRADFQNGILTIYINGVQAIVMETDFVQLPSGRFISLEGEYPIPYEITTSTGQGCTISNYKFLAPDENLQQVKQRYIYTEGEFTEDIDSEVSYFSFYPGYTYTYTNPANTNILDLPSFPIGTPTLDSGDMIIGFGNASFVFDDDISEWDAPKHYYSRGHITQFETLVESQFHGEPVTGSPYLNNPPYSRVSPYYMHVSLIHFPIGYPKCPTPYTAVVYVKAVYSTNQNTWPTQGSSRIIAETDANFEWGIPGVLTGWVELARVPVLANTKGSIDIADNFVFPVATTASTHTSDHLYGGTWYYGSNSRRHNTYAIYSAWNKFDVKLVMEMDYDYV